MYQGIRKIVSHASCADGTASVMILKSIYPSAKVEMIQYGTQRDALVAEEGMLFCDMSPPDDRVQEFIDAGAYVLDHHKTAKPLVEAFGERGIFADEKEEPGVSGTVLAYRHLLELPENERFFIKSQLARIGEFARLCGIRDTWQRDSPDWEQACVLHAALLFYPLDHWLEPGLLPVPTETELVVGQVIIDKQAALIKKLAEEVLVYQKGDEKIAIIPAHGTTTSDLAEYLRSEKDIHTLATFFYTTDNKEMTLCVSMRSDHIDVGKIAKEQGGGGHTNAAGFELKVPHNEVHMSPLIAIRAVMEL